MTSAFALLALMPHAQTPPSYKDITYKTGEVVLIYPPHLEWQFQNDVFSRIDNRSLDIDFKDSLPNDYILLTGKKARLVIVHPETGELKNLKNEINAAQSLADIRPWELVHLADIPAEEAQALRDVIGLQSDGPKVLLPTLVLRLSTSHAPTMIVNVDLQDTNVERERANRDVLKENVGRPPHLPDENSVEVKPVHASNSVAALVLGGGFRRGHSESRQEALLLYDKYLDNLRIKRQQLFSKIFDNLRGDFPVGHDIPVSKLPPDRQKWLHDHMRIDFKYFGFNSQQEFDDAWPNLKITTTPRLALRYGHGRISKNFFGQPVSGTILRILP